MYRFYEFFAGGGMARLGLGDRWNCLYANDIDPKKAECYSRNWGDSELHLADVHDVRAVDLPSTADLAWASFPCQDLSLAGNYDGLKGSRSGTFWPFWRLMEQLRAGGRAPALIVLENVCGALTSHNGRDFAAIGEAIVGNGYHFGAVVMDAVDFVPQSRRRLFIIAVESDFGRFQGLTLTEPDAKWHLGTLIRAWERLSKDCQGRWLWWSLPKPAARGTFLSDMVEEQPTGVDWHTKAETNHILGLMSEVNRLKVDRARQSASPMVGTVYRRTRSDGKGGRIQRAEVRFDGVAGCLRTPAGGSSRQIVILVRGDNVRTRLLSPREAARLMGLADDFWLPKNYNDAYHIVGDGLVIPVIRHLASHLLEPILARSAETEKREVA